MASDMKFIRVRGRIIPIGKKKLSSSSRVKTKAANTIDSASGFIRGSLHAGFHKRKVFIKKMNFASIGLGLISSALRFSRKDVSVSDSIKHDLAGSAVKFGTGLLGAASGSGVLIAANTTKYASKAFPRTKFAKNFMRSFKNARARNSRLKITAMRQL